MACSYCGEADHDVVICIDAHAGMREKQIILVGNLRESLRLAEETLTDMQAHITHLSLPGKVPSADRVPGKAKHWEDEGKRLYTRRIPPICGPRVADIPLPRFNLTFSSSARYG